MAKKVVGTFHFVLSDQPPSEGANQRAEGRRGLGRGCPQGSALGPGIVRPDPEEEVPVLVKARIGAGPWCAACEIDVHQVHSDESTPCHAERWPGQQALMQVWIPQGLDRPSPA